VVISKIATLHWIGKEKVVNHTWCSIPLLDHKYGFTGEGRAGFCQLAVAIRLFMGIILKVEALLPENQGKINDLYRSALNTGMKRSIMIMWTIRKSEMVAWSVGKEGEDLTRHDNGCAGCFPRLNCWITLSRRRSNFYFDDDMRRRIFNYSWMKYSEPEILSEKYVALKEKGVFSV